MTLPPDSPFAEIEIDEVKLIDPPLARVLVAIQHLPMIRLQDADESHKVAVALSAKLGNAYPIAAGTQQTEIVVKDGSVTEQNDAGPVIRRLQSKDQAWQVSIGPSFIAFETSSYQGRRDFINRLSKILEAYLQLVEVPDVERIGIRYTNQLTGQHLDNLAKFVRAPLLGVANPTLPHWETLNYAISQAVFRKGTEQVLIHWGLLPSNGRFDFSFQPRQEPSWILDIDVSDSTKTPLQEDQVVSAVTRLSNRAHTCFRWAVTEEYINNFREV